MAKINGESPMKELKIECYLPEELIKCLEKYSNESKNSKEEIIRKALYDFFMSHPLDEWREDEFQKLANISRKLISRKNNKE